MRFVSITLLIFVVAAILQCYLPWWIIAVVAFGANLIWPQKGILAFLTGFIGIGATWMLYAIWIDWESNNILSKKIATLFNLPSSFLLILISLLISGLVGGFGALTANQLRRLVTAESTQESQI